MSRDMDPTNRGKPQSESARRRARRERELNDMRAVLSTREGRRLVWRLLEEGKVFCSTFTGNSVGALLEGRRALALIFFGDAMKVDSDILGLMWRETEAQRIEDEARED